jgi:hypothetical protein
MIFCFVVFSALVSSQLLAEPSPTPNCGAPAGEYSLGGTVWLESQCETNRGEIILSGSGSVGSKSGSLLLHRVKIVSAARVTAPRLIVDEILTVEGDAHLSAGANAGVFVTNTTKFNIVIENKGFALINLGTLGPEWKIVPESFTISFSDGQSWGEDELRAFDHPLVRGVAIGACEDWVALASLEGENKDDFELACETLTNSETIIKLKGVLGFWTLSTIIGIACGGIALLIILFVIAGVCCCRSPPPKKGVDDAALERKKAREAKWKARKEQRDKEEKERKEKERKEKKEKRAREKKEARERKAQKRKEAKEGKEKGEGEKTEEKDEGEKTEEKDEKGTKEEKDEKNEEKPKEKDHDSIGEVKLDL